MELSQLPGEMVAEVACHLTDRDCSQCCAASAAWRTAFNLDHVWRPRCSLGPAYFANTDTCMTKGSVSEARSPRSDNFNQKRTLKTPYESPFVEGSDLEPLCEWREAFQKEKHIRENWRTANFSTEQIELHSRSSCVYLMDAVDLSRNHWLFLCCTSRSGLKLDIWNVNTVPYLQTSVKMSAICKRIEEVYEDEEFILHLCEDKLLFIYENLVTVCDFRCPDFEPEFLYNFSFVHTAPAFTPRRIARLPEGSLCRVRVINGLLYGVVYTQSDRTQQFSPSVHVWDIHKAEKIKDSCVFEPKGDDVLSLPTSLTLTLGNSENLGITRVFDNSRSRVCVFNKVRNEYNGFYVKLKHPVIWTAVARNILVVCELVNNLEKECIFTFYNVDSASTLLETSTHNIFDPEKISCTENKFAFIDLHSDVTVYDILTQKASTIVLHPSRNRLKSLTMINDQLILLESRYRGTSRSFQNILVTSYEIWDFAKSTKPLRFEQCYRSMNRTSFTFAKDLTTPPKLLTIVYPMYRPITVFVNSFW